MCRIDVNDPPVEGWLANHPGERVAGEVVLADDLDGRLGGSLDRVDLIREIDCWSGREE